MFKAVETEDWRRKYFDTLRAVEQEERRYLGQQQTLQKLVARLCLAAQGQSPRMDQELKRLKEAVRREAAGPELETLGQAIADAVHEIDHGTATLTGIKNGSQNAVAATESATPDGAIPGDVRLRGVLARLLAELRLEPRLAADADDIDRELGQPLTPMQLPQVVERIGGLVMRRIQGLSKARQELELLLGQLVSQLDSLTRYVAGQEQEESARSSSSAALNSRITVEMQALGESVETGTDLVIIRRQLRQRLDAIGRHLLDFREREESLTKQSVERAQSMRKRMQELEAEANQLHTRLSDEKRLSMLDSLTQIPNRLAYEQRIVDELDRWKRFAQPTCIATWDIDAFKHINDSYGHRAGDKVLSVVAECLAKSIRSTDFVARYGGEEFIMLLPGTTLEQALKLANQMREAVSQLGFHFRGVPVSVTISCGISMLRTGDVAEEAFDRADKAMYQAKESGRNRVVSG